jgi:Ulp1 family protease
MDNNNNNTAFDHVNAILAKLKLNFQSTDTNRKRDRELVEPQWNRTNTAVSTPIPIPSTLANFSSTIVDAVVTGRDHAIQYIKDAKNAIEINFKTESERIAMWKEFHAKSRQEAQEKHQQYNREIRRKQQRRYQHNEQFDGDDDTLPTTKSTHRFKHLVRTTPLTSEEITIINNSMTGSPSDDDDDAVVSTVYKINVTQHSIKTLQPGQWINDECINAYMKLLENRVSIENRPDRPYFFNSFFYAKYMNPNEGGHDGVKTWTTKREGKADLFTRSAVIFPINNNNVHWTLAVAHMKHKCIVYYDSMGATGKEVVGNLFRYLEQEHLARKSIPLEDGWRIAYTTDTIPQQNNCHDCGAFLMFNANLITSVYQSYPLAEINEPPIPSGFSQENLPLIRKQIHLDLLRVKVFPE